MLRRVAEEAVVKLAPSPLNGVRAHFHNVGCAAAVLAARLLVSKLEKAAAVANDAIVVEGRGEAAAVRLSNKGRLKPPFVAQLQTKGEAIRRNWSLSGHE